MSVHLYIFEDGMAKQSMKPPAEEDYQAVEDGILAIYRWNGQVIEELNVASEEIESEEPDEETGISWSVEWISVKTL
jgi:hypothetical protein